MADRDPFDDHDDDNDRDDGFLTFDAREEEEDQRRGPLILAAVVLLLFVFGAVLYSLYTASDSSEPAEVALDENAFKAPPQSPSENTSPEADKLVFESANGGAAPPLEVEPTQGAEDPLMAESDVSPPPFAPTTGQATPGVPAPAAAAPKPAPKPAPAPAPAAVKAAPAPAPAPVKVAKAETPRPAAPAPAAPKAATPPPAPKIVAAAPEPAPAPKAAPAAPASSGSRFAAQLGSFQTRAAADAALARYRATGLQGPVSVVAADLGAKGTWHRIRATGFDTRAEVEEFCGKARDAGAQCIPASR
jgi:cell division protein FtsN